MAQQGGDVGSRNDAPIDLCEDDNSDCDDKQDFASVAAAAPSSLLRSTATARMSVSELKRLLDQRNVDYSDCVEKRELVQRLERAQQECSNDGSNENLNAATASTKRLSHDGSALSTSKRPRQDMNMIDSHIKLGLTDSDSAKLPNPVVSKHCLTLRQMLGFDKSPYSTNDSSSIDWMVASNFMVDLDYLLNLIPELYSIPECVVFYGQAVSPRHASAMAQWKQATNVDFVELDPSADPKSSKNPLKYKFPYGVHHTKMFLVGMSNGSLRVIVHTANLVQGDCQVKTQGAYIQDFPLKRDNNVGRSEFENDLVNYVETYGYKTPKQWSKNAPTATLCEQLRKYEFSSAKAVLIASTPGYHSTNAQENKPLRGYLKLSKAIHDHCPPAAAASQQPIVCQFSSMGSLNVKWLKQFATALNASQQSCDNLNNSTLNLVFPTAEEVRNSVEGYAGGGSVPSAAKNVDKEFLQPLYHKWSCDAPSILHKPRNVPHIKTFYQTNGDAMQWFCITSHNLSTAAWGQVQKSKKYPGQTSLFIRHWELGVMVAPRMFGHDVEMKPIAPSNSEKNVVGIPLPYPLHPTTYGQNDEVFSWNKTYTKSDAFGRRSTMEY